MNIRNKKIQALTDKQRIDLADVEYLDLDWNQNRLRVQR